MGCDIHAHFEIKVNGEWLHYSNLNIVRNYLLFEKMAGIRGDGTEAISLPKGLPEDISQVTSLDNDWFGTDGHSHSWLSAGEVRELLKWEASTQSLVDFYSNKWGFLFGNSWEYFPSEDEYPKEIENFRLVFWFDN